MENLNWMSKASCRNYDPEDWFTHNNARLSAAAKTVCRRCPVLLECRIYSLSVRLSKGTDHIHGIWGGLSDWERGNSGRATFLLEVAKHDLARKNGIDYG